MQIACGERDKVNGVREEMEISFFKDERRNEKRIINLISKQSISLTSRTGSLIESTGLTL